MLCYHAVTRLPSSLLVYIMYIFLTNVLDFGCGKVGRDGRYQARYENSESSHGTGLNSRATIAPRHKKGP
jgi:hypothetical protein